jgi:hypothetical protein
VTPTAPDAAAAGKGGRGGAGGAGGGGGVGGGALDASGGEPVSFPDGGCGAVIENHADEGANHVNCMTTVPYQTMPPSSGNHYCVWPDYRTYTAPLPWGNLVHALEHGAVEILYNCPGGCPDEVAQAQAFIDNLPADPLCDAEPNPRRVVLAPAPTLDVRWAASAWTWILRAGCFDRDAFAAFVNAHYGQGREATCAEWGLDPSQFCPAPCTP